MSGIGNDDFFARPAMLAEIGPDQHEAGKLALSAGGWLQTHIFHGADLGEYLF